MAQVYSDDDEATVRMMWLDGASDAAIGAAINRSAKAVRAKRREMCLTPENYPERRIRQAGQAANTSRNVYTSQDEADILDRYWRGESVGSIAATYNVIGSTMKIKLDRLVERAEEEPRPLVSRLCLGGCGKPFLSRDPKKIKRICPNCAEQLGKKPPG
jgi:hypothetical protein